MVIFAEKIPPSPPQPLAPSISLMPPPRRRVSFAPNLHDFDFPVLKTWGSHHVLRCLNVSSRSDRIDDVEIKDSSNSGSNVTRPCNLRTRRVPIGEKPCEDASPRPPEVEESTKTRRTVRLRSDNLEKRERWPKISIRLSKREIEEDVYALTGSRPRRRPKKRPKVVQQQIDELIPGSCLPSITRITYRVTE